MVMVLPVKATTLPVGISLTAPPIQVSFQNQRLLSFPHCYGKLSPVIDDDSLDSESIAIHYLAIITKDIFYGGSPSTYFIIVA